ncbi:MAG: hypothetical protein F6K36_13280 [Symploca sp. SIO3C6]|nr:hypothetical protein [Symploca sp. SIO3C6]
MSKKMTVFENSELFTDLSIHEQEAISGGGLLGDAWNGVKKVAKKTVKTVKKHWKPITIGVLIAGGALFSGGKPTGGSTNGGKWVGGKWEY